MRARRLVVGGLALASLGVGIPALAAFRSSAALGGNSFSTATLAPPTGPSGVGDCMASRQPRVTLSWTASASAFADGYDVYRSLAGIGVFTKLAHVPGGTATSWQDGTVGLRTTYDYYLKSTAQSWTSAGSSQVSVATPQRC